MSGETPINGSEIDAVIRRVRAGDTGAYEILIRHYERSLRAWLAVRAAPGIDVDEIAQLAFVAAFTRLDDYALGTNFAAWLFTIARYQLKTEVTRLRRVADYHARYAPDLLQRELERRVYERPEFQELRLTYLKACLDELGEHARQFIAWRYEAEIPLEEMAHRSGRSVAAVKKQLWKSRNVLKACVERRITTAT